MRKIVVLLVTMLAFVASASIVLADNGPAEIVIKEVQKKFPPVTFKHAEHQSRIGDCTTCHHKSANGDAAAPCSQCHGKDEAAPGYKDAMHKSCQGCHKKEGGNAPTKCNGCHVK
jgi:cytochrome c553